MAKSRIVKLGVGKQSDRLVAVMRETCKSRLGMRARLWLDMTDDDEVEDNLASLAAELKQSPDTSHYFNERGAN